MSVKEICKGQLDGKVEVVGVKILGDVNLLFNFLGSFSVTLTKVARFEIQISSFGVQFCDYFISDRKLFFFYCSARNRDLSV